MEISKDPSKFATNAPLLQDPLPQELWPDFPAAAMIANNLLTFDHHKHLAFRPLISSLLSAARVEQLEPAIRALCVECLGRLASNDPLDFAEQVALPFPVSVVLGLVLGIPREDQDRLTRHILAINAMEDPRFCAPNGLMAAADELFAYGKAHVERCRHSPGAGVLGQLLSAGPVTGMSKEALFFVYWFPLTAGAFDTTAATIAGGVSALLAAPAQLRLLRANPRLIPLAVEELIRWVSPVIYFRRTATQRMVFREQTIHEGDTIILCYASANRDEDVFANPDELDITREPNHHVSFGYGPHYCLGAPLARAMIRIFLEEFIRDAHDLQLEGQVAHTRSAWMNRIWSMPVRRCST